MSDFDIAVKMLSMMDYKKRSDDHHWIEIGKALYNAHRGLGFKHWCAYTAKYTKKTEKDCEQLWMGFSDDNYITHKTLAWYAREDNKILYDQWHQQWVFCALENALTKTHTDVAAAFCRIYWLDYMCAGGGKKWYHFRNHRWYEQPQGITMRSSISSAFVTHFMRLQKRYAKSIDSSDDENKKKNWQDKIKSVGLLIRSLKSVPFKSNIMREATESFYYDDFDKAKDNNSHLFAIGNGVLETHITREVLSEEKGKREGRVVFRSGKPEDYITKGSSVYYDDKLSLESEPVKFLMDWLLKIFGGQIKLRHYFLKFAASILRGGNDDKLFPFLSGEGNNGKSKLMSLFEKLLGMYCVVLPITVFTGKRGSSSGPNPELAQLVGARFVIISEPGADVEMFDDLIKMFSGGDTFFARGCNSDGGKFKVTFKMMMQCNNVPKFKNLHEAVKNRVRIFPCLGVWKSSEEEVDSEDESDPVQAEEKKKRLDLAGIAKMVDKSDTKEKDPNIHQADTHFDDKIAALAPALLWLMKEYFPIYASEGMAKQPATMRKCGAEYFAEHRNEYKLFADAYCHKLNKGSKKNTWAKTSFVAEQWNIYATSEGLDFKKYNATGLKTYLNKCGHKSGKHSGEYRFECMSCDNVDAPRSGNTTVEEDEKDDKAKVA